MEHRPRGIEGLRVEPPPDPRGAARVGWAPIDMSDTPPPASPFGGGDLSAEVTGAVDDGERERLREGEDGSSEESSDEEQEQEQKWRWVLFNTVMICMLAVGASLQGCLCFCCRGRWSSPAELAKNQNIAEHMPEDHETLVHSLPAVSPALTAARGALRMGNLKRLHVTSSLSERQNNKVDPPDWFELRLFVILQDWRLQAVVYFTLLVGGSANVAPALITAHCHHKGSFSVYGVMVIGQSLWWLCVTLALSQTLKLVRPKDGPIALLTDRARIMDNAGRTGITMRVWTTLQGLLVAVDLFGLVIAVTYICMAIANLEMLLSDDKHNLSEFARFFHQSAMYEWEISLEIYDSCISSDVRNWVKGLLTAMNFLHIPAGVIAAATVVFHMQAVTLASALTNDAVQDLTAALDPIAAEYDDETWHKNIRRPAIALTKKTLPLLMQFQHSIAAMVVGCLGLSVSYYVIAISADSCTYLVGWVMITLWPFLLLIIPTLFVSNECDTLLNRLNDLRQVDAPKRRGHSPTASPASAQEMTGLRSLSSSPTGSTGSAGGVSAVLQTYGTNSAEQSGYHEFRPMHLRAFLIDRHNYGSVGQGLGFVMFQYVVTLPLLVGYQGVFWAVAYTAGAYLNDLFEETMERTAAYLNETTMVDGPGSWEQ
jgi:hypothetical protein